MTPRDAVTLAGMLSALARPLPLWAAFSLTHLWLGFLALYAPGQPIGDVTQVYRFWVEYGFDNGIWVGIDTVWVYPILALVPMLAAAVFGLGLYASTWLSLVMVLDALAFAVLLHGRRPGSAAAAWWWMAFLVLLGPVAIGRIDAITVAVAIPGLLLALSRPALGTALLTAAAWLKVWPAALVAAVLLASRQRLRVLVAGGAVTAVILLTALALGAGSNVLSFVTQQTGRGLQIEAVLATPWMWDASLPQGDSSVAYDPAILTFQVYGPGVREMAAATTPLLAIAALALLGIGALALRRGRSAAAVLPPLALALTVALIAANKVGSPQFAAWLAVPVIAGLVAAAAGRARSFRVPAVLALVIAALTQVVYPYLYADVIAAKLPMVIVLSARNALYLVLLAWAVVALVDLARRPRPLEDHDSDAVVARVTGGAA